MGRHRANFNDKLAGGVLLGAVASGLAAAAVSGAGTANATCASISGVGNSADCFSSPTSFAVALGPNTTTTASANGLFDGAISNGLGNTGAQFTASSSTGNFSLAYAGGPNTFAQAGNTVAGGTLNLAVAQGSNVNAFAGADNPNGTDVGNAAFNIANNPSGIDQVFAGSTPGVAGSSPGIGNLAANLGGTSSATSIAQVNAIGQGNLATNIGGAGNIVQAGDGVGLVNGNPAVLGTAFSINGTNNQVTATGGPLAIAGAIGGVGKVVTQTGTGVNIG